MRARDIHFIRAADFRFLAAVFKDNHAVLHKRAEIQNGFPAEPCGFGFVLFRHPAGDVVIVV